MKNGAAVVVGALVMFVSGYFLGYSTAVPDLLRASALNLDESSLGLTDDGIVIDVTDVLKNEKMDEALPDPVTDEELSPESMAIDENKMSALEIDALKKMIIPMMTDEEIKKIRDEAASEKP